MLVGGSAKAWIVVPAAAFEDNFEAGGFFDQGAGVFEDVARHVFGAVGALAKWVGGDRTGAVRPILSPVCGFILPFVAPGKVASVCSSSGFFPLCCSGQPVAYVVLLRSPRYIS